MLRTRMAEPGQLRLVVPPTDDGSEPRRTPGARRLARPGRIVAVGGGKGGVGKSLVAASIGIELAGHGCRVALVDCDLGGANLHTSLGLIPPRQTLSDDPLDAANPNTGQKMRFIRQLQSMEADFVVLDLAAGTQKNTLDFFLLADQKVLVFVPEPGAVENAHRFVKAAFMRRLRAAASVFGVANLLDETLGGAGFRDPSEIFEAIEEADAETGRQLREQMNAFRPGLVVNQARTPGDAELGRAMAAAWRRTFGIEMDVLGTVEHDEDVWRSARERRPLLLARSECRAARSLARVASRIQAAEVAAARR